MSIRKLNGGEFASSIGEGREEKRIRVRGEEDVSQVAAESIGLLVEQFERLSLDDSDEIEEGAKRQKTVFSSKDEIPVPLFGEEIPSKEASSYRPCPPAPKKEKRIPAPKRQKSKPIEEKSPLEANKFYLRVLGLDSSKKEEKIELLKNALRRDSRHADAAYELGCLQTDYFKKKKYLTWAIKVDPTHQKAYRSIGKSLEKWDHVEVRGTKLDKVDLLSKAIELDPTDLITYISIAYALKMGQGVVIGSLEYDKKALLQLALNILSENVPSKEIECKVLFSVASGISNIEKLNYKGKAVTKVGFYKRVLMLNPNHAMAALRIAKYSLNTNEKLYHYRLAVQLKPELKISFPYVSIFPPLQENTYALNKFSLHLTHI